MAKIFCVTDIQTLNFRFFFGYLNTDKSSEGLCWYPGVVGLSVNNAVAQVLHAPVLQHPHQGDVPHHHQPAQAAQEQEQVGQKNQTWKYGQKCKYHPSGSKSMPQRLKSCQSKFRHSKSFLYSKMGAVNIFHQNDFWFEQLFNCLPFLLPFPLRGRVCGKKQVRDAHN